MKQYRVLFNPLSGDGAGKAAAMHLMELLPDNELRFYDITKIDSVPSFLAKTDPKDTILVAGGDGTLRRFADAVSALPLRHTVYYYATGRDNDFWRDLGRQPATRRFRSAGTSRDFPPSGPRRTAGILSAV